MCVDWNCIYWYMLLEFVIVNWDDDMVWIGELEMSIDNVLLCELLLRNDELKVNMMNCLRLNDLLTIDWIVFVIENDVKVECDEMRNEMWVVDDERMIWAIEIVDLRCELDWIVELCELHVFDGNELVVLNG